MNIRSAPVEPRRKAMKRWLLLILLFGWVQAQPARITTVEDLYRAAASGGAFQLAAGSYQLGEPLNISKNFSLVGAGQDTPVFRQPAGYAQGRSAK
jgi:hypothetical protein